MNKNYSNTVIIFDSAEENALRAFHEINTMCYTKALLMTEVVMIVFEPHKRLCDEEYTLPTIEKELNRVKEILTDYEITFNEIRLEAIKEII